MYDWFIYNVCFHLFKQKQLTRKRQRQDGNYNKTYSACPKLGTLRKCPK